MPDEALESEAVYILDFSYPLDVTMHLQTDRKVTILDHHVTAKETLLPLIKALPELKNLEIHFDMERSGAGIAWDYFHRGAPRHSLIDYIEDRDLWRFKLPFSREVHAALVSYPMSFNLWDTFTVGELIAEGKSLVRLYDQLVEKICARPWIINISGHHVPVVNTTIAWSEVGDYLLKKFPQVPFVASFTEYGSHTMWSLRSGPHFDVSQVAKKFGGGGHKQAAGFKIERPVLQHHQLG